MWEIILSSLTANNLTKRRDYSIHAYTTPPPTTTTKPVSPPSLYVIPHFSCRRLLTSVCIHTHTNAHQPPFLQTDSNRLLVLLMSAGVSFEMNLYTSTLELTSIGLNSFNSHDICLLAYLLSKQAPAQLASWETVTLTFVCVREENATAGTNINSRKMQQMQM